jgi:phosphonate transport system substrate-binding protein
MKKRPFTLGAVAYAPKVVTIWEGFRDYFRKQGMELDYVLYSNYEAQVDALFSGTLDTAWNSPLAWIRSVRMGQARGTPVFAGPMRDTDQDLSSVLIVRKDSHIQTAQDLKGKSIGFGAIDSPQARLIPLDFLNQAGLVKDRDFKSKLFDELAGKHGDHIGGERSAARAVLNGELDAAWMIDGNFLAFSQEGTLPAGETRIVARTGLYDHCIFTMASEASRGDCARFTEILLGMKWADPAVRPLLELEGLKEWRNPRTHGFELLNRAVDQTRFYDHDGKILEANYRY